MAFDSRGAFLIAPAAHPEQGSEQAFGLTLRHVASRGELAQGTYCYDRAATRFTFACRRAASRP